MTTSPGIPTETRRVALETGLTTTVECWGEAGPAVLCVHGIASSRRDFARLGEALAATHRVFAYDQRGHGDNVAAGGAMTLAALAADLRAVADSIGTVAVVVGHSWGGAVALVGGPKIARALVLIDPMIRVAPHTFTRDYVDDLAELLVDDRAAREAAIRGAFANAHPTDREGKVHAMRDLALETIARLGRDNRVDDGGWDLRERLGRIKIPVTVLLAGEESVVAPDDFAGATSAVHLETIEGHGHALHRTAFERFVGAVRAAA
jgi:pimeloyl-ACP methyl ester carboxylesterase